MCNNHDVNSSSIDSNVCSVLRDSSLLSGRNFTQEWKEGNTKVQYNGKILEINEHDDLKILYENNSSVYYMDVAAGRQKVHYMLHMVNNMIDLGPATACFQLKSEDRKQ